MEKRCNEERDHLPAEHRTESVEQPGLSNAPEPLPETNDLGLLEQPSLLTGEEQGLGQTEEAPEASDQVR